MPYLLFLKMKQNFKLSSAANFTWLFMGLIIIPFGEIQGTLVLKSISTLVNVFQNILSLLKFLFMR